MTGVSQDSVGRRVVVELNNGSEYRGTLVKLGKIGVLVRRKGASIPDIFENDDFTKISLDEKAETLKAAVVKQVKVTNVRRHLLNHHGWLLTQINSMTDEEAMEAHTVLHGLESASNIGHIHRGDADDSDTDAEE